jgi:hypothetical protein
LRDSSVRDVKLPVKVLGSHISISVGGVILTVYGGSNTSGVVSVMVVVVQFVSVYTILSSTTRLFVQSVGAMLATV